MEIIKHIKLFNINVKWQGKRFMKDKLFLFIPYQDSDNFLSDGILTREFAMLYMFWEEGYNKVINVKKPRTLLDKRRYKINNEYYPEGTIECIVKSILDNSKTVQYLPLLSGNQLLNKRRWWEKGYLGIKKQLLNELSPNDEVLVYSDNPFAVRLLEELKKERCKIYFDIMDNFAVHPSLSDSERASAMEGYKKILSFSDIVSANSIQTCEYMKKYTHKDIILVKNGVFLENEAKCISECSQIRFLIDKKKNYEKVVGYIGKLGKRLDAELIREVSRQCKNVLFVFVGPYLKGQINEDLISLFNTSCNVLHLDGIPSAYVYSMLNQFDVLMIPHSVGKNENGGDPLKLYQYLTRGKPIISTPILGVDEFKNDITISMDIVEWVNFIKTPANKKNMVPVYVSWEERIKPVFEKL